MKKNPYKIRLQRHLFATCNKWIKWQDISVDIKTLSPVCPCTGAIYMYKIMKKKQCMKSDFKEIFLKLATNDQSDEMFLLTSKFHSQSLRPCPGAIYMYKIVKKNCIKSDFKESFLKLVANDQNDKLLLLTSNFVPWDCLPLTCGYILSNDDPGLTLTIFMTGSNLFLMLLHGWQLIKHWVLLYFQVCCNSA